MLKIQRASAGSGKTYTLTLQYILNLIAYKKENDSWQLRNEKQIEEALQHILAITFTNKATNEMKERIINNLSLLAQSYSITLLNKNKIKDIPYLIELQNLTNGSFKEISIAADKALRVILNNYSLFKISTIDSFFQEILRTFTYEANIPDSYQVEIDSTYVNEEALTSAFQKIDSNPSKMGNSSFWLKVIMEKEAQKSQQWNPFIKKSNDRSVYNKIRKSLAQLENENFKEIKEKIDKYFENKESSRKLLIYYKSLKEKAYQEREDLLKDIKKTVIKIENLIYREKYDLNHLNSYFIKHLSLISNLNIDDRISFKYDSILSEGSVFKKKFRTSPNTLDIEAMNLYSLINNWKEPEALSYYKNWKIYGDLLPYMGLMQEVKSFLSQFLQNNNIIQLHDTSYLLKKIIGEDETPFIYEKLGNKINHYLIDEFQDTSQMQWDVIQPLLSESESKDSSSLIIGDPKQSIYRFRNAKHTLITKIVPETFKNHIAAGFSKEENTNWRSHTNIVRFNNYFFDVLASSLTKLSCEKGGSTDFEDLYSNVVQFPHNQKGQGYIEIRLLDKPSDSICSDSNNIFRDDEDQKDWFDIISLNNLCHLVSSLIKRGYKPNDIGILVNTNEKGKEVVEALLNYNASISDDSPKIDFISEESLLISSSKSVEIIINVLEKFFKNLNSPLKFDLKNQLKKEKQQTYYDWNKMKTDYIIYSNKYKELSDVEKIMGFLNDLNFDGSLSSPFNDLTLPSISSIVEIIVKTFLDESLKKAEAIYISSFQDLVNEYSSVYQNDPISFLEWWNSKGKKISISAQNNLEAVQIMTIHKSKGLEFKCVIIPFATDNFLPNSFKEEWRWIEPLKLEGLENPPVLPVKTSQELIGSSHQYLYAEYLDQVITDKLNMYYVAFTRAKNELYVFTKKSDKKSTFVQDFISQILSGKILIDKSLSEEEQKSMIDLKELWIDKDNNRISLGSPFTSEEIFEENKKNLKNENIKLHFFDGYFVNNKRPRLRSIATKVLPSGDFSN